MSTARQHLTVTMTPDEATGWAFRLSKSADEARCETLTVRKQLASRPV